MYYVIVNLNASSLAPSHHLRNALDIADRKEAITRLYTDHNTAVAEAQKLAAQFPTKQYAVMNIMAVYETTTPKVVVKKYNEHNELVLEKTE